MNIKHSDLQIPEDAPFTNCKLDREKYAKVLTNIVNSYPCGFVLAINNKWGAGKTTFVKMWEQDLKNNEYQTLYFNAWENDFEDNPLIALMGELKTLTTSSTNMQFKSILKKAAVLTKHIAPILAKAVADKYIDTKGVKEAIEGITKGMSEVFENEVNSYADKKKGITEFKESLSKFIADTNDGKPLIFIIDELDRCRPNYAVSILEQIKHFFSISNIVFVLAIDKVQLGNAVKGVYGSHKIDSEEYFRRFIDIEYSIPEPEADIFYKYLYDYFDFKDFFDSLERKEHRELSSDGEWFLEVCRLLFNNNNIPLRQQEKIFGLSRVALRSFKPNSYVVPPIFIFLAYLKVSENDFYEGLKNKTLTFKQVQQEFLKIVEINKNTDTERQIIRIEAYLLIYYDNYSAPNEYTSRLFNKDSVSSDPELLNESVINNDINLLDNLKEIHKSRTGKLSLGYFIDKIELLENLKH